MAVCFGLAVVFYGVSHLGRLIEEGATKAMEEVGNDWYSKGFARGQSWGRHDRNNGNSPNIPGALYYEVAEGTMKEKVQADIDDPLLALNGDYEVSGKYPSRGSDDFGDFSQGFEQGYVAGYYD